MFDDHFTSGTNVCHQRGEIARRVRFGNMDDVLGHGVIIWENRFQFLVSSFGERQKQRQNHAGESIACSKQNEHNTSAKRASPFPKRGFCSTLIVLRKAQSTLLL